MCDCMFGEERCGAAKYQLFPSVYFFCQAAFSCTLISVLTRLIANIPSAAKLKIAHCNKDHNFFSTPFSMMHLQITSKGYIWHERIHNNSTNSIANNLTKKVYHQGHIPYHRCNNFHTQRCYSKPYCERDSLIYCLEECTLWEGWWQTK